MVKGFAIDLKGHNINANCIAPGAISNVLPDSDADDVIDGAPHDSSRFTARLPAEKGGLPSDIANAVLYLTSELGQYVNGETILVDGGMVATKTMQD